MRKENYSKRRGLQKKSIKKQGPTICSNRDCKLRKGGCRGFEGCPGYKEEG